MIEAVLEDFIDRTIQQFSILDIGCGNGDISQYFCNNNNQYAVDVRDQRKSQNSSFQFSLVDSEELPFDDAFFDIVISNHVIEHLKDHDLHLREICRVLKGQGVVYLATPNKSSPFMAGHKKPEDNVLRYRQMNALFKNHSFIPHEYGMKIAKEPDRFKGQTKIARFIPLFFLRFLRPLYPSHMFVLTKPNPVNTSQHCECC